MKRKEKNMAITQKQIWKNNEDRYENALAQKGAIKQYVNCEINEYELADKIGLKYTEIGTFLMINSICQVDPGALYAIICPKCNQKWLTPRLNKYTCGKCQTLIEIDYKGLII